MYAMSLLRCAMRSRAVSEIVSHRLYNCRAAGIFFWKHCWKLEPEIFIVTL